MRGRPARREHGCTTVELLIVVVLTAVAVAATAAGWRHWMRQSPLERAAEVARGELTRARSVAVGRRIVARVSVSERGELVLADDAGRRLRATPFRARPFRLDSLRLRPPTLRINARGQGSAGSLYLYRGGRGIRIVVNFIGRIRLERLGLRADEGGSTRSSAPV